MAIEIRDQSCHPDSSTERSAPSNPFLKQTAELLIHFQMLLSRLAAPSFHQAGSIACVLVWRSLFRPLSDAPCSHEDQGFPPNISENQTWESFNSTFDRWLYNKKKQLSQRQVYFSIPALKIAAILVAEASKCIDMVNPAQGSFNRGFLVPGPQMISVEDQILMKTRWPISIF